MNGFDFHTGVVLPLDLGVLSVIVKCFVADESALRQVLRNTGCKRASAMSSALQYV